MGRKQLLVGTAILAGANILTKCMDFYRIFMIQLYRRRRRGAVLILPLIYTGMEHHCWWIHRNRFPDRLPGNMPCRKMVPSAELSNNPPLSLCLFFEHPSLAVPSLLGCRLDCPACLARA